MENVPHNLSISESFGFDASIDDSVVTVIAAQSTNEREVVMDGCLTQKALAYITFILIDSSKSITVLNINKLLAAANLSCDSSAVDAFVDAMRHVNPEEIIGSFTNGSSGNATSGKIEEGTSSLVVQEQTAVSSQSESSDDDLGFGLFD